MSSKHSVSISVEQTPAGPRVAVPVGTGDLVQPLPPTHAAQHDGCEGCQHRYLGTPPDWCYMFRTQPKELPCAQHDDFADLRSAMARTPLPILAAITASLNTEVSHDQNGEPKP